MIKSLIIWLTYLIALGCTLIFRQQLYPRGLFSQTSSISFIAAGTIIVLAAKLTLGKSHSTLPEARGLKSHGIYSKIRHPIYTGWQLIFWGLSFWFASLPGFAASTLLILPLHLWRARQEEKLFKQTFGKEYLEYKAKTWF